MDGWWLTDLMEVADAGIDAWQGWADEHPRAALALTLAYVAAVALVASMALGE